MQTRRTFLQAASASLFLSAAPGLVRARNLNSRLQIAGIGCDGKGWSDIAEMAGHGNTQLVGFCDVDTRRMQRVHKLNPEAPQFQDYREMFAELGEKIDAVTVSTPDHMHAVISVEAMQRGKHVYCQKPLTHNVWEARQMIRHAETSGVITRMGNQIHSHQFYRTAVHLVQEGTIGNVRKVFSWCGSPGHGRTGYLDRPAGSVAVPSEVNWDLWVGVAPMRPYGGDGIYHPFGWRDWQDFGNGALGDFGCHILDPVYGALGIADAPTQIRASSTGLNSEVWPAQTTVEYRFPGTARSAGEEIEISWMDGGLKPKTTDSHVPAEVRLPASGSLLIGELGSMVLPHWGMPRLYPQDSFSAPIQPLEDLNHYHGWVDGCLSGQQPSDGFDSGGRLTEAVLLGNIAIRFPGETLQWDADQLRITNLEAANRWIRRDYRDGWSLKTL